MSKPTTKLRVGAQFSLFVSSYLPLFVLLILRQIYNNAEIFNSKCNGWDFFIYFLSKFGLSIFLLFIILIGLIGLKFLFSNLKEIQGNSDKVRIVSIKNKNNEAISYIATYIIPFLFQKYDSWYEIFAIIFLLLIIYNIYINSTLLLINPFLNIRYSIYEIKFIDQINNGSKPIDENNKPVSKTGMVIIKDRVLEENEIIYVYLLSQKLYFGNNIPESKDV